jgi:hypothetical protein
MLQYSMTWNYIFKWLSTDFFRCKIWCFHCGDYEECRLLGYKNLVHSSQEAHYISAIEPSRLMLFKILGFHGRYYEEFRLLGFKNPDPTSQETHYISSTERNQLMLCKIWGFHGGGYEEYRLLGYKNPILTSQRTYTSTTKLSRIMICKIWVFHGGEYEECRPLGCGAVWVLWELTFRKNVSLPFSGWKNQRARSNVSSNVPPKHQL